ncbi:hypothetical protein WJX72_002283 [[Myrmecia] bisecta]|uniref:Nitrate reductase n=1 Tax=[Myrmecia] bisecta TaxID=41462 RepID=A0AAW1PXX3_9CHLO
MGLPVARAPTSPDQSLTNEDFSPTTASARTFDTWDLAALWIGLVVSITTYYLAGGLVDMGMSWWQGILTVLLGNVITLIPMVLNAHPGTKYGIPFPVLARASFGVKGANLPSLLRAFVACGWFGIQTWVGSCAIHKMLAVVSGGATLTAKIAWLGISSSELACFLVFWAVQAGIIVHGIESIRKIEKISAPLLIGLSMALMAWAYSAAGGFGPMLSAPSQFGAGMAKEGQFWGAFLPAVTANVGYWATLSLNIPDFTRYAKSQKDQLLGQAIGLPLFMALFTFVGLAVTSATITIYGAPVADPIELLGKLQGMTATCLALFGLIVATLSTNIAANIVAPANAIVNLAPGRVSFVTGGLVTSVLGILIMPWKLISSTHGFIFTFLIAYSALLGPIGGIVIADYYLVRKRVLDIDGLYSMQPSDPYWFQGGWNPAAVVALVLRLRGTFEVILPRYLI